MPRQKTLNWEASGRVAKKNRRTKETKQSSTCTHKVCARVADNRVYCQCGKLIGFVRLPGTKAILG